MRSSNDGIQCVACSPWEAANDARVLLSCLNDAPASAKCGPAVTVEPEINPFRGLRPFLDPHATLGVFRHNDMISLMNCVRRDPASNIDACDSAAIILS